MVDTPATPTILIVRQSSLAPDQQPSLISSVRRVADQQVREPRDTA
jgi:hypothetical protein